MRSDEDDGGMKPASEDPAAGAARRAPGAEDAALAQILSAAEGRAARPLADASFALGRLEAALAAGGLSNRLRVAEASYLLWRGGWPVRAEALALYMVDGAPRGQSEGFERGKWLLRRLEAPLTLDTVEAMRRWLGWSVRRRAIPETLAAAMDRPSVREVDEALGRWLDLATALEGRSQLARAGALAFAFGRETAFGRDRELVAAVLGARLAAQGAGGLAFAPVAFGASRSGGLRLTNGARSIDDDLDAWLSAVGSATHRALLALNALALWRLRAEDAVSSMRGATGEAVIGALHDHLAVSAAMVSAIAGCSRATAERALARLAAAGVAREITGGRRWRFWTANA